MLMTKGIVHLKLISHPFIIFLHSGSGDIFIDKEFHPLDKHGGHVFQHKTTEEENLTYFPHCFCGVILVSRGNGSLICVKTAMLTQGFRPKYAV